MPRLLASPDFATSNIQYCQGRQAILPGLAGHSVVTIIVFCPSCRGKALPSFARLCHTWHDYYRLGIQCSALIKTAVGVSPEGWIQRSLPMPSNRRQAYSIILTISSAMCQYFGWSWQQNSLISKHPVLWSVPSSNSWGLKTEYKNCREA